MKHSHASELEFIHKITAIIHQHLSDEHFGISELAAEAGMSRTQLFRRLKTASGKNISRFVNDVRLQAAFDMLREGKILPSETAFKVGFSSVAYFTKCFRERYGYPPGEVKEKEAETMAKGIPEHENEQRMTTPGNEKTARPFLLNFRVIFYSSLGIVAVLLLVYSLFPRLGQKNGPEFTDQEGPVRSIAVLPVANLTGNPGFDYIAEGINISLTDELYRLGNLQVRPAHTSLKFTGTALSPGEIAGKMKADLYVKPSLMCSGDSFCVSVQLYQSVPEEKLLWSDTFVRDNSDVFMIFKNSALNIAEKIDLPLTAQDKRYLSTARKVDPEFFNALMLGRHYINKVTPDDFQRGVTELKRAMDINPLDPAPYLALATGYSNAGHASEAGSDASEMARAYALKALQLDSTLAEAHAMLAAWYLYRDWNWDKTEYYLNKAISINPDIPLARYTKGWYLGINGYNEESINEMKKAVEIDPLDPICIGYLAWLCQYFGMWEESIKYAERTLEVEPGYPMAYYVKGLSLSVLGRHKEAIETQKKGLAFSPAYIGGLAKSYAFAGLRDSALQIATRLEKDENAWNAFMLATLYTILKDKDNAFRCFDDMYTLRSDFFAWIKNQPLYRPLHDDVRFKSLVAKLKLPS